MPIMTGSAWTGCGIFCSLLRITSGYRIPTGRPTIFSNFDSVRDVTLRGGDSLSLTRYSPLEFPAYNTIDSIDAENIVRFRLAPDVADAA